jgi:hypothetical protein
MHVQEWLPRQTTGIAGGTVSRNHAIDFNVVRDKANFVTALLESELSEVEFDIFNKKKICLVFALMLSLGLWAIIWVAVSAIIGAGLS